MAATSVAWKEQTRTAKGWLRTPVRGIVRGEPISVRRPDPGQPAINARDRIGDGPWYHARGTLRRPIKTSEIHGDTLVEAQRGANMFKAFALTEKGDEINGVGDPMPNLHDMLTGTQPDGRAFTGSEDRTCNNWTSNDEGAAQVGHSDRIGHGNQSWNSSHATTGCSQEDFASWNGAGLFYCFAVNSTP